MEAVGLGSIKSLLIGHNRDGSGAGWFLEKVLVREGVNADAKLVFPCNKYPITSLLLACAHACF